MRVGLARHRERRAELYRFGLLQSRRRDRQLLADSGILSVQELLLHIAWQPVPDDTIVELPDLWVVRVSEGLNLVHALKIHRLMEEGIHLLHQLEHAHHVLEIDDNLFSHGSS